MKLSIVMPSYNEGATIAQVIQAIEAVHLGDLEKEIIVVDGQSTDGTRQILDDLAGAGRLRVIEESVRRGKGHAVRTGMAQATGDLVIVQDADLELNPQEYLKLLAPIRDGSAEVVYGSRFLKNGWTGGSRANRFGNWLVTTLVNVLFGSRLTDVETCYKLVPRSLLQSITLTCDRFDFDPELTIRILRQGVKIHEVPVTYRPRTIEEGKKIRWTAGFDALRVVFRLRLTR